MQKIRGKVKRKLLTDSKQDRLKRIGNLTSTHARTQAKNLMIEKKALASPSDKKNKFDYASILLGGKSKPKFKKGPKLDSKRQALLEAKRLHKEKMAQLM